MSRGFREQQKGAGVFNTWKKKAKNKKRKTSEEKILVVGQAPKE